MEPADEKPTVVERRVDEEAAYRIDSTVQQQQEEATEHFKIPRTNSSLGIGCSSDFEGQLCL